MDGIRAGIEKAYKRLKKDYGLYKEHKQRKYDGLPTGLLAPKRPIRRKRPNLNRPDVYGDPPRKIEV